MFILRPNKRKPAPPAREPKPKTPKAVKSSVPEYSRMVVLPRTISQKEYIKAIQGNDITFGIGPAGTGKTLLAVSQAVEHLIDGSVDKIMLVRPAVEAGGEKLGFLPGSMKEKLDPYLQPMYDALNDSFSKSGVERMIDEGIIEICSVAHMRGRTLKNAFIIIDEAQNTNIDQIYMILTRLGKGSKMVVTGDPTQNDLPKGQHSGLKFALHHFKCIKSIGFIEFDVSEIVRHPTVAAIVNVYEEYVDYQTTK